MMVYLILLAGFRLPISDYTEYLYVYFNDGISRASEYKDKEITLSLIVKLSKLINNSHYTFFIIYALLGVSIKMFAIRKLSPLFFLPLVIYLSNFYIHQDMVQIRAGVASALFLLAIKPLYERKLWPYYLLCSIALCFHYSAAVYFLVYPIIQGEHFNKKYWLLALFASVIVAISKINVLRITSLIPISFIQKGISFYLSIGRWQDFQAIGFRQILEILLACIFIKYSDRILPHNKYFIVLLKLFMIGIIARLTLALTPVIANRISDLFLVVEIILYPMLIYTLIFKEKPVLKASVICIGILYLLSRYSYMTERVI